MSDSRCIKCFMMAMQRMFVLIRNTDGKDDCCIELLGVFENYIDIIPNMELKEIANLKDEIKGLKTVDEEAKEYIVSVLKAFATIEDVDDIQSIISNIPVLKDIIGNLKELIKQELHERVHDLADAVHNYPEMLTITGAWSPSKYWDIYIKPYRNKWDKRFLDRWEKNFKSNFIAKLFKKSVS